MRFHVTAGLAAAGLLAGCSTSRTAPPPPPVQPERPALPPTSAAPAPAAYVSAAASADLFVVRASELASRRLAHGADRRLAEMLVREHQGMSAQLSLSGRRVNLLPSATLLARHRARLATLEASGNFAADYRRQMRAVHEELLSLHTGFAASGSSPTLRPVAAAAATRVRSHLAELR